MSSLRAGTKWLQRQGTLMSEWSRSHCDGEDLSMVVHTQRITDSVEKTQASRLMQLRWWVGNGLKNRCQKVLQTKDRTHLVGRTEALSVTLVNGCDQSGQLRFVKKAWFIPGSGLQRPSRCEADRMRTNVCWRNICIRQAWLSPSPGSKRPGWSNEKDAHERCSWIDSYSMRKAWHTLQAGSKRPSWSSEQDVHERTSKSRLHFMRKAWLTLEAELRRPFWSCWKDAQEMSW